MPTIEHLEQNLLRAFNPDQARLLAQTIHESYNSLVHASDFHELKEIVGDLSENVRDLSAGVKELASSLRQTQEHVEDLAAAQQRTEERVEELAAAQQRTEERVEELATAQQRTEQSVEKLSRAQEETSRAVRLLARQVGGLSDALGGSLEDFALEFVPEILERYWPLKTDDCSRFELELKGKPQEIDLFLTGSLDGRPITILGEVKSNITPSEVERFLKITELARPTLTGEVRVIFFGYRASREARDAIRAAGAYCLSTQGKIL
ncbi:MAG: hypothetical protein HS115_10115 [Spirochaetales bacterium]|nr:hypothetical protein [Spirochaetales bacterium]